MLSSEITQEAMQMIDTNIGFIELLGGTDTHKYLGRTWPGNLRLRADTAVTQRINAAWAKFHQKRPVLTNRLISLRSRLRLFSAVVSPTLLYCLPTVLMTQRLYDRIDVV